MPPLHCYGKQTKGSWVFVLVLPLPSLKTHSLVPSLFHTLPLSTTIMLMKAIIIYTWDVLFLPRLNCLAFDLINGGFVLPPSPYLALIFSFILVTDDWKIMIPCEILQRNCIFDYFAACWWHFRNIQPTREEVEIHALKILAWKHMPAFCQNNEIFDTYCQFYSSTDPWLPASPASQISY